MDEHEHKIKQLGMGSEISLEIDKDDGKTLDDKKSCISSKKRVLYFLSILVIAVIILFVLCIYFKMIWFCVSRRWNTGHKDVRWNDCMLFFMYLFTIFLKNKFIFI